MRALLAVNFSILCLVFPISGNGNKKSETDGCATNVPRETLHESGNPVDTPTNMELSPVLTCIRLLIMGHTGQPIQQLVDIDVEIPTTFDPFSEAKDSVAPGAKEYFHIRIQQMNGNKSLTELNYYLKKNIT